MLCLLDTNVLLRSAQPNHAAYRDAVDAADALIKRGENVVLIPQVIVEFWTASTRPVVNNGLGFTPGEAEAEVRRIETLFPLLPESAAIFETWRKLVVRYGVSGLETHDARVVAAMLTHGITHVLTFNEEDFRRYKEITVLTPQSILSRGGTNS
jgi:predicted nucleic acid-binding protein